MADILITSLQGGQSELAPIALDVDQCVVARNVEWFKSPLGERRLGADAIDLTGSDLLTCDRIVFLYRHFPTTDPADAQLWALGITDGAPDTATLAYKDTTWHTVSVSDAITLDGVSDYLMQAQTLHGKLFLAYNSAVDRLHVWDGTSLRRTGLAEPAAPTAANTGSGTFSGTRYYRVRYTVQSSGVTLRRSEPSDVFTFAPSGSGSAARVTKPTTISESETHWELEASLDNVNFYVIATTVVGTTTADDTVVYATGYATAYSLSEDIGDYALIPSVKYLSADDDRLFMAGSFEDEALASRVMWTPVKNTDGVGNDERLETDTDPSLDLDNYEGGAVTGVSANVSGYVYVTKSTHIYQVTRTGVRTKAYEAIPLTKQRGGIIGSLVEGFDQAGRPFLFALDPDIGPIRIGGENGVEPCGADLIDTWETVNLDAVVVARGVYFPEKKQVHWWIATGASTTPDLRLVLHTTFMRDTPEGSRKGWAVWDGPSAAVLAVTLFATNIDADTDRTNVLAPVIGGAEDGLIWLTDTGNDDNGTAYAARLLTKPYTRGNLLHQFEISDAVLMGKVQTGAVIDVTLIGNKADEGITQKEVANISFTALSAESDRVIRGLDSLGLAEMNTIQVEFEDSASPGGQWKLELFAMKEVTGQQR